MNLTYYSQYCGAFPAEGLAGSVCASRQKEMFNDLFLVYMMKLVTRILCAGQGGELAQSARMQEQRQGKCICIAPFKNKANKSASQKTYKALRQDIIGTEDNI